MKKMKVYELMNALSEANAGADVRISFSMTSEEFIKGEQAQADLRVFSKDVEDIDFSGEWTVSIYG